MRVHTPRGRGERGSMSVALIGVVFLALVLTVGAAKLGSALVGRARADTAADAAALAAADMLALGRGSGTAVAAASETAAANGAELVSCDCGGRYATVEVAVDVGGLVGASAHGRARAEVRPECHVTRC